MAKTLYEEDLVNRVFLFKVKREKYAEKSLQESS